MANTSTIHIKTDFDCKVFDYGQEIGTTKADTYCNFELRKGEHELTFVFVEDECISKTIDYKVKDADCDYRLIVVIIELLCNKAKDYYEKKNYSSAFLLFSTAAKHGNAMAQNYLGECYEVGKGVEEDVNEAISWYTKAVEQGNASAQYHLAQFFDCLIYDRQHLEVKQNLNWSERHHIEYAVDLYTKAAKQGHAGAQYLLGLHYEYGGGVERCITKAIDWYTKAAEQGDAEAQCQLGLCLYNKGADKENDPKKAVKWFTKAAKQGNELAQYWLGISCFEGKGVEKDPTKALEWFTKAAEQGITDAQYNLGVCYEQGNGTKEDPAKAVEWYTKAAEQGNADAQYNLGVCYEQGNGAEKDSDEALIWYTEAAEQGHPIAQYRLGLSYEYGKACGEAVERDTAKAIEWYTKAAEQGLAKAQYRLGAFYEAGIGVEIDLSKALELYTKAAEQGCIEAQKVLGDCYKEGNGVDIDLKKAFEWYSKAAKQGDARAQYELGGCYYKGNGVEKSRSIAIECWKKAAEQGLGFAQLELGDCYEKGDGVERNITKALKWYYKAYEQDNIISRELAIQNINRIHDIIFQPEQQIELTDVTTNLTTIHYLFFDTETAGLPRNYNAPTHHIMNWPRLVQLSWITTDEDCNVLSQNDFIIYPDGFTIPSDASKLHGITTDIAKEKGRPLKEVMEKFMEDFNNAKAIVGHNIAFDKKIIGAELIRLGQKDIMHSKESLCTMETGTEYCKIPSAHGYKWPKLQELHKKLFGYEFEDAHNSMSDVTATLKCFKEMRKRGLFGWQVKSSRSFTSEEIASVERNEVVASQYGKSVGFYMVDGGQTFIPLSDTSSIGVDESIDLTKAKLITLGKYGKDDILRVEA